MSDHPTRPLDPAGGYVHPDAPTTHLSSPDPALQPCPKCGGTRVWLTPRNAGSHGGPIILERPQKSFWSMDSLYCAALTCAQCGYVEWYALNPQVMQRWKNLG